MFDLFGSELPLAARFFIAFLVVLVLIGVVAWLVRRFGSSRLGGGSARGRQPRLAVIDAAPVDGRRRLVLIRRDNVEHLLMIGGPTDVVVEQNIVRGMPARTEPAITAGAAMTPPAVAPMQTPPIPAASRPSVQAENAWPLQPGNETAPVQPSRPYRTTATEEPWLPPEPGARPRPAVETAAVAGGSLTGLAAELSTRLGAPESPAPAVRAESPSRPAPPVASPAATAQPASGETSDHNLAEMAQQLEAALRRSPSSESGRPPVTDPLAVPLVDPATRPTGRDYKLRIDPKFESQFDAKSDARPQPPAPERKPEPRLEKAPEPRVEPRVEAKPQTAGAAGKTVYDSLEEEMASLLGRPPGKT